MANQSKGSGKADAASGSTDKENATETRPSYAEMLKKSKLPEAKKQQAADAIEEILAGAGEDRLQLLGHLRALVPETGASSSGNEVSPKTRIHRVGNALGKASSKVTKHTEEIVLKQKTWEKCSRAIREWAASQRKAYEKDLEEAKEALEVAQKEEKEAMTQLKDLQAQLEAQGPQGPEEGIEIDPVDDGLFDTPPSMQEKDSGMTPMMKKLSLKLQEANVEKEELKRQNMLMMEETQRLFLQMQQSGSDAVVPRTTQPKDVAMPAEEVQKKLEQDRQRRHKQLEKARSTVAQEQAAESAAEAAARSERERSPRKGDSQNSMHSLNSLT